MNSQLIDKKILVVDDEIKACANLKLILERKQFSVMVAHNGGDAVTQIYKFQPDIILTDILMPGLPGDELIKIVHGWKPDIKIIVITAVIDPESQKEYCDNGAYTCIQKPVYFEELLIILENLFQNNPEKVL